MVTYERPAFPEEEYRDATGTVIDYGRRWEIQKGPPQHTYSVVTHPQRFSPVVVVADALIEHLATSYDVTVTTHGQRTSLDPGPHKANLQFDIHRGQEPQVEVHAGMWSIESFPFCSCDACDEDIIDLVTDLEQYVFTVVKGGLREAATSRHITISLEGSLIGDTATISQSTTRKIEHPDRRRVRRERQQVPAQWLPWTPRAEPRGKQE